jgi:hypothetical protein
MPDSIRNKVLVNADLIPLWYITILQLQESEVVIDSLRASLNISNNTIKYQAGQLGNYKRQTEKLNAMNKNLQEQNKTLSTNADGITKFYLRWRTIGRISIGVAALFGIIAITR